ncbi:hypothetical protein [Paenibacillus sp. J31TS4]|uniref:hypothetical protein n=1 Tax=Paenibacillus sp. J31TS4 TaxID=2807195 RepID=UPI001BCDED0B|nr:hypothetical protein [Paenibacillus sp. J31TS4]
MKRKNRLLICLVCSSLLVLSACRDGDLAAPPSAAPTPAVTGPVGSASPDAGGTTLPPDTPVPSASAAPSVEPGAGSGGPKDLAPPSAAPDRSPSAPPAGMPSKPAPSIRPTVSPDASPTNSARADGAGIVIRLQAEPRLGGAITALVGASDQRYDLIFPYAVNRESVEKTIASKLAVTEGGLPSLEATAAFEWVSEEAATVTIKIGQKEAAKTFYPLGRYRLDVNGARTAGGFEIAGAPVFVGAVASAYQIARLSTDGRTFEKVSAFADPYFFEPLVSPRYVLASRSVGYCECDATFPKLSWVYDLEAGKLIAYPAPLSTAYRGTGSFVADTRGFFFDRYDARGNAYAIPGSETAYPVRMDGTVLGVTLSPDMRSVLVVTGAGQPGTVDLVRLELKNGARTTVAEGVQGVALPNLVSDKPEPVRFQTVGSSTFFALWNDGTHQENRYAFSWTDNKLSAWSPPVSPESWSGFQASGDDRFRLYANAGLYEGSRKLPGTEKLPYPMQWLPGTHSLVGIRVDYTKQPPEPRVSLERYEAERQEWNVIREQLPEFTDLLQPSADGRWIYLTTPD